MKRSQKSSSNPKQLTQVAEPAEDLQAEVRVRAHELYEQRGREGGGELEDWLRAEAELVQKKARAAGA